MLAVVAVLLYGWDLFLEAAWIFRLVDADADAVADTVAVAVADADALRVPLRLEL